MGTFLEITTSNYNGQFATITFLPCSGGSIYIGQVTLPYYYDNPYYYGTYQIYIPKYDKYCDIVIQLSDIFPNYSYIRNSEDIINFDIVCT